MFDEKATFEDYLRRLETSEHLERLQGYEVARALDVGEDAAREAFQSNQSLIETLGKLLDARDYVAYWSKLRETLSPERWETLTDYNNRRAHAQLAIASEPERAAELLRCGVDDLPKFTARRMGYIDELSGLVDGNVDGYWLGAEFSVHLLGTGFTSRRDISTSSLVRPRFTEQQV